MASPPPPADTATPASLTAWASQLLQASDHAPGRRYILGIAGIPGSGKSTLAAELLRELHHARQGCAKLIPMDGFHLPDEVLQQHGTLARKGSPATFDAQGYLALLQKAQQPDTTFRFPIYDRKQHKAVVHDDDASRIDPSVRVILTEGNYLLLRQKPWDQLEHLLDACWFLHVPPELAKERLIRRHVRGGRTEQEALKRYDTNDGPNSYLILTHSRQPGRIIHWPA